MVILVQLAPATAYERAFAGDLDATDPKITRAGSITPARSQAVYASPQPHGAAAPERSAAPWSDRPVIARSRLAHPGMGERAWLTEAPRARPLEKQNVFELSCFPPGSPHARLLGRMRLTVRDWRVARHAGRLTGTENGSWQGFNTDAC